jgi:predicted ribosomally synthesized peptide with SipW-like signal peptide
MSLRASVLMISVGALAVGLVIGATHAAFSSTSDSSGTFSADTRFDGLRLATGSYTGDGADAREIGAAGFRPDVVIVKAATAQAAVMRTSTMTGDASKPLGGAIALQAGDVESLDASGFTVGTGPRVNGAGVAYEWTAIKADGATLRVGAFTGNGNSRSITGLGFTPSFVAVLGAGATTPVLRMAGTTRAFPFDTGTGSTTQITSLGPGRFSLGTDPAVNAAGATYHYVAVADATGTADAGAYTGTGKNNTNVNGVGFRPDFVLVRADDATTSRPGRHRPASMTGNASQAFGASADVTTAIRALRPDGFRLGNDASVNAKNVDYAYFALSDVGP